MVLQPLQSGKSWDGRAQTILGLVRANGWTRGAELGVYQGETTEFLLEGAPNLYLVGVDHWSSQHEKPPETSKETGVVSYAHLDMVGAEARVRELVAKYWPRLTVIKGDTASSASLIDDGSLDFIFVDASHVTADVVNDITAWRPKVRGIGGLLGHDINWPSVQKALDQLALKYETLPGHVWRAI